MEVFVKPTKAELERALELSCIEATKVVGKCDICGFDFYKDCQKDGRTCDQMLKANFLKLAKEKNNVKR